MPQLSRHDGQFGMLDSDPLALVAHFCAPRFGPRNRLESRSIPDHLALLELAFEHRADPGGTPIRAAAGMLRVEGPGDALQGVAGCRHFKDALNNWRLRFIDREALR